MRPQPAIQIFLAVTLVLPLASSAEEISCKSVTRFKSGGEKGHSAKIVLENEKISSLFTESHLSSGKEGGGYSCYLDSSELNPKPRWSYKGKRTLLTIRDGEEKSVVAVTKNATSYVIDLTQVSSSYCGFGAEWPNQITIELGKNKCVVVSR